ncbi:MAG: hypothetical protein AAF399_10100 [Bacteroidota bacterium]
MKLIYLSEANLRDRLFIKDFVFNYKSQEKALVFHAPFGGTVRDTRFVTKRISSLLSEAMVYNNAFSADQRNFFSFAPNGELQINREAIEKLLWPIQQLLFGPVMTKEGEAQLVNPLELLQLARHTFEVEEVTLFPDNPMSPLGSARPLIDSEAERDRLIGIYEEESPSLNLAHQLRPARVCLPANYAQEVTNA